jgi:hypothetical protein
MALSTKLTFQEFLELHSGPEYRIKSSTDGVYSIIYDIDNNISDFYKLDIKKNLLYKLETLDHEYSFVYEGIVRKCKIHKPSDSKNIDLGEF